MSRKELQMAIRDETLERWRSKEGGVLCFVANGKGFVEISVAEAS